MATPERTCGHCGKPIADGEGVEAKAILVEGGAGDEWLEFSEPISCCSPAHALALYGGSKAVSHD